MKGPRGRRRLEAATAATVNPVAWVTLDAALEAGLDLVRQREPAWSDAWAHLRGEDIDAWIDAEGRVSVVHRWHHVADPPRTPAAWREIVADWSGDVEVPLPF